MATVKAPPTPCSQCEPLTCEQHTHALHRNIERLRMELTSLEASLRNAEDKLRAHRRFHAARTTRERKDFLAFATHAPTDKNGPLRGERECELTARGIRQGGLNVLVVHGANASERCKLYALTTYEV